MKEYIEREAAKAAMTAKFNEDVVRFGVAIPECFDNETANAILDDIPAADVREIRKSHWFDGACFYCGFKPALDYEFATVYDKRHGYAWNFCPNCGCSMEVDDGT